MTASNRKRPKELAIVVPKPSDEQPRFGRLGVIAAVGFVVGVAWPGLARVELVPQPPNDSALAAPSLSGSAATLDLPAPETSTVPPRAAPRAAGPKVRLADVVSCVDADGRKRQRCDAPALDTALSEPLKSLLACDGAEGQSGVLSLGFDIDFGSGTLNRFTVGRSTTLDTALARSLADCAKVKLNHVDVSSIEHGYSSYRVFYVVEFARSVPDNDRLAALPESSSPAAPNMGEAELQGQSGRATVTWDVAIVRKAPKDGAIVARVLGGTRVIVNGRQGDWYRIKYNAKGDEGFVFKSAIGL